MNNIVSHPDQPEMQVEVILASQGPDQDPIYTIRMRYPRIIHGEIMTHRVFSRNARSSRAVPVQTMLNEVREKPFVPWHWGKNQKGMQANEECHNTVRVPLYTSSTEEQGVYEFIEDEYENWEAWRFAADNAADMSQAFMEAGYHKQIPNRLLEPFSWIDTLITATEWENFLWLRDHKDAEPHLQDLARLVKQALEEAEIQTLEPGEWHLPYITENDRDAACFDQSFSYRSGECWAWLCKISAARCARISYKPFDGDASYERELARYDMLVTSDRVHASPTEHQATPDNFDRMICDYAGEMDYSDPYPTWRQPELHGNLTGYIQARKLIPNEAYTG